MSFAETYVMASKVRSKLTRQAANPKTLLVLLVLQANMLDNLMDTIAEETKKRRETHVSFSVPEKRHTSVEPSVTEYEVESDSDDDLDYDSDPDVVEFESELESDDDYYYSDGDEVPRLHTVESHTSLTLLKMQSGLLIDQKEELPELTRLPLPSELSSDGELSDSPMVFGKNSPLHHDPLCTLECVF